MLKNFWYAVHESAAIGEAPVKVRLLGRDLALVRGEGGHVLAIDAYRHLPVEDDEEPAATEALAQDALTRREGLLGHGVRHRLQLWAVEVGEEGESGESVEDLHLVHADHLPSASAVTGRPPYAVGRQGP